MTTALDRVDDTLRPRRAGMEHEAHVPTGARVWLVCSDEGRRPRHLVGTLTDDDGLVRIEAGNPADVGRLIRCRHRRDYVVLQPTEGSR